MSAPQTPIPTDYHRWRSRSVSLRGGTFAVAVKPGLIGQGRDEAAQLLAEEVVFPVGGTVVAFQSGSGIIGAAAAAGGAAHVYLSDRNVVAEAASRRTLELNGITHGTVVGGQGSASFPPDLRADLVTIRIPTEKAAVAQLLVDAFGILRVGGRCCIAGANNEGIKSAASLLQELFGNTTVLATRSGCRAVMAVRRAGGTADAFAAAHGVPAHDVFHAMRVELRGVPTALFSRPGVFSWEHLDEATALLVGQMRIATGDTVLDLGCGSGPLGIAAARLTGSGQVSFVDVDAEAVRCAQRAVQHAALTNCEVRASDVASAVLDRRFDVVISNPPFHVGKGTDLDLPAQFILDAHAVLKPGGSLQLVANRTLPYERLLQERFGHVTTVHDGPRFKILAARR